MAKKEGMYFYADWLRPFEKLTKAEVGELVIAMMRYFLDGTEPPVFDGLLGMAQDFIFPQIDRSLEYARLGSKGGNATKERVKKTKEKAADEEFIEASTYVQDRNIVIDHIDHMQKEEAEAYMKPQEEALVPEKKHETPDQIMFRKKVMEDYFIKFWREYPRKAGKSQAFEVFCSIEPDRALVTKMVEAIKLQKESESWKKEDGRYIPYPENWLEKRRWEDEPETPRITSIEEDRDAYFDEFFNDALKRAETMCDF